VVTQGVVDLRNRSRSMMARAVLVRSDSAVVIACRAHWWKSGDWASRSVGRFGQEFVARQLLTKPATERH